MKKEKRKMKVCLVGSSGGHLTHLYMLKPFWKNKERFWVTFDKEDYTYLLFDCNNLKRFSGSNFKSPWTAKRAAP